MATVEWIGNAKAVAQVTTVTASAANSTEYSLTINGKEISYTSDGDATAAEILLGLYEAWTAAAIVAGEYNELTAELDDAETPTVMTITGPVGLPFVLTSSGAGTLTVNDDIDATGPNHVSDVNNWSGGALPSSSDTILIRTPVSLLYDLDALAAIATSTFRVFASFWSGGASIGLPKIHRVSNTLSYNEYRDRSLQLDGATKVEIGQGIDNGGQAIINLDFQTSNVDVTVYRSPKSNDLTRPAILITANPGAASGFPLEVLAGSVGVGFYGETCKVTPKIGHSGNVANDSNVILGTATTIGSTFDQSGGVVEISTATTAIAKTGGTLIIHGSGAHPVVDNQAGLLVYNSSGNIGGTSVKCGGGGTIDFSQDMTSKTLSNAIQAYRGATIINPNGVVSGFAVKAMGCRLGEITIVSPVDKTWTPS
ncbi:MAG: hypothetical protein JNL96_11635 [Planctomycetaceae bacterium]|nr:hypothetical protein [Planctomycetaceae bacterium]